MQAAKRFVIQKMCISACRYFGVLFALQKVGVITPGVTPVGGVSGGSVAAASSCLGLDFPSQVRTSSTSSSTQLPLCLLLSSHVCNRNCTKSLANQLTLTIALMFCHLQVMPAVQDAADKCRTSNLCAGNLHSVMDPTLKSLLLPAASNATALARCRANTQIYVSEGQPVISIRPGFILAGRLTSVQIKGSTPQLIDKSTAEVRIVERLFNSSTVSSKRVARTSGRLPAEVTAGHLLCFVQLACAPSGQQLNTDRSVPAASVHLLSCCCRQQKLHCSYYVDTMVCIVQSACNAFMQHCQVLTWLLYVCWPLMQGFVDGIVANWFIPYYWSQFGTWSTTYRYCGSSISHRGSGRSSSSSCKDSSNSSSNGDSSSGSTFVL
jgi:hypothetical protein